MAFTGTCIAQAARPGIQLAVAACDKIEPADFGKFPTGRDGEPIRTNHPAFIIGHLCLYPASALELVGQPTGDAAVPESWNDLYKPGIDCENDPDRERYHAKDELLATFKRTHQDALARLENVDDKVFTRPHPNEQARERFPTVGAMVTFYLTSHVMFHMGQLSAWRRASGFGPVM